MTCIVLNIVIGMSLFSDTPINIIVEDCGGSKPVTSIEKTGDKVTVLYERDGIYYFKKDTK